MKSTRIIKLFVLLFSIPVLILCVLHASSPHVRIIKNPKPNMVEKDFRELIKIGEIEEELAPDEFLFYPFSITMDAQNNLYIYDLMQAKILKLDDSFRFVKSWGRVGAGPGEFSGTGIGRSVYLNVGLDGKLYAHDIWAFKVLVFTTAGKFLHQLKLNKMARFDKPITDKQGSIISQEFKKDRLIIFNENKNNLISIPNPKKKKDYLFTEPKIAYGQGRAVMRPWPLSYDMSELCMRMTMDGRLLLYFRCSSKLYVVKDGKKLLEKYLWPREAVKRAKEDNSKNEPGYRHLFFSTFTDNDNKDFFYLQFGGYEEKKIACVYKFNLDGELVSVLYMDYSKPNNSSRLLLKQNNLFIGKHGEQLYIYKE